jgi:Phage capsid family
MTAIATRDRLKSIRERTHNARQARARARTTLDAAQAAGDTEAAAIASLALDNASVELETAGALESMLLASMAGVNGHSFGGDEGFLDDPNTVSMMEQLAHSSAPIGSVMLGSFMSADRFAASLSPRAQASEDQPGLEGYRKQKWPSIVRQIYRPLTLLDLIPTGTMTGSAIEYVVELGDLDAGVAETAEGALKPEGEVDFEEVEAPARTIAVYVKQRRQVIADVAELQAVLQSRLSYQVLRRIEQQCLIGDGAGQNLMGLLNTTGIGVVPNEVIPASDLILKGMTMVSMCDAVPSGVVVHPMAYEALLTEKTSGSGERLDSGGAFDTPGDTVWGIPIIRSAVIDPRLALVGDFTLACSLLVREGVSIRLSDSDSDDFLRNRVTILAEARVALPVWQPRALAEVELAPPGP